MSEQIENNEYNERDERDEHSSDNINAEQQEQNIIERSIKHVDSNTATEEEKLIVKLWKIGNFTTSINEIFDDIFPLNTKDSNIKNSFVNLENAFVNTYNTIYKSCGNSPVYACDTILQYLSDVFIGKIEEKNKKPSRTFVLLNFIRNEMEDDKWYTIEEMWNIIDLPEYREILKIGNIGLLLNACVQEGYFEEKRNISRGGKTLKRHFKKTDKVYLDFEEEKIGIRT